MSGTTDNNTPAHADSLMTMEECAEYLGIDESLVRWGVMTFPSLPHHLTYLKEEAPLKSTSEGKPWMKGKWDFSGVFIRRRDADRWKAEDGPAKVEAAMSAWTQKRQGTTAKATKQGKITKAKAPTPAHVEPAEQPSGPTAPESATTLEPCATGTLADPVAAEGLF